MKPTRWHGALGLPMVWSAGNRVIQLNEVKPVDEGPATQPESKAAVNRRSRQPVVQK
jgi:hypothetical protein